MSLEKFRSSAVMKRSLQVSLTERVTTTAVAKEMTRTGRKPHDRSERMILNNYATMQRIREIQGEPPHALDQDHVSSTVKNC